MIANEATVSPLMATSPLTRLLQQPEPLSFERHWRYGLLVSGRQYLFARPFGLAPIGLNEFATAARDYPIVFPNSLQHGPCAAMGVSPSLNLMVDSDGSWRHTRHIPAAIRCYPFTLLQSPQGGAPQLALDMASPLVVLQHEHPYALPLYNADGTPSELTQRADSLCQATQRDLDEATAMVQAFRSRGLFVPQKTNLHFKDGGTATLADFDQIDATALEAIAPNIRERWQAAGWLAALTLQADSRQNWARLIVLQDKRLQHALQTLRLKDSPPPNKGL